MKRGTHYHIALNVLIRCGRHWDVPEQFTIAHIFLTHFHLKDILYIVPLRDFFQKHLTHLKILNGSFADFQWLEYLYLIFSIFVFSL